MSLRHLDAGSERGVTTGVRRWPCSLMPGHHGTLLARVYEHGSARRREVNVLKRRLLLNVFHE